MYDLKNVLPDELTKEYILNRVSELEIFQYFIGENWEVNKMYRSTFRKDKKPTAKLYYSQFGKLNYRDFSGHFWGDCFALVQFLYCCDYIKSLEIIDFHLSVSARQYSKHIVRATKLFTNGKSEKKKKKNGKSPILVEYRNWKKEDVTYWQNQYGIGLDTLQFFNVHPCNGVWINSNSGFVRIYTNTKGNPAYTYLFDKNTGDKKVYFPYWNEVRFRCNSIKIQGWDQLPETGELCIITKSMKDVMYLYTHGYISIAPQSESNWMEEKDIDELKDRFKRVITLFDNDSAGGKAAFETMIRHGLDYRFIPACSFEKDPTDFHVKYGVAETKNLLKKLFK